MKYLEPHRIQKDKHVIEDVIQERADYFLGSLASTRVTSRIAMTQTRELPPEMRPARKTTQKTFYWGS